MDTLQNNKTITQLLQLMEGNGQQGQAADLRQLCGYVDTLEEQYAAVLSELQDIKQQLTEATKHPLKDQLSGAVQAAENSVQQLGVQLFHLRDSIIAWAGNTMKEFRQMGISALDDAVAALGIRQSLEGIRERLTSSLHSVQSVITQVETIGQELRTAGSHIANAGRAAAGKEVMEKDTTQEGRFQAAVLAPMRGISQALSGMTRTADAAISRVNQLERAADQGRGKRERPSVRKKLEQKKSDLPPASPRKEPKKSEVSL